MADMKKVYGNPIIINLYIKLDLLPTKNSIIFFVTTCNGSFELCWLITTCTRAQFKNEFNSGIHKSKEKVRKGYNLDK